MEAASTHHMNDDGIEFEMATDAAWRDSTNDAQEDIMLNDGQPTGSEEIQRGAEATKHAKWQDLRAMWVALGLDVPPLTERDRTCGVATSLESTFKKYINGLMDILRADTDPSTKAILAHKGVTGFVDDLRRQAEQLTDPPQEIKALAATFAIQDERELDQRITASLTLSGQIDALCSALTSRTELCDVCLSALEAISAFVCSGGKGLDNFWPERDIEWDGNRGAAFTDGTRLLPPENVKPGDTLPPNVIQHHINASNLPESAKDCPLCELLRIAIILDSFRKYDYPIDRPTEELSAVIMAIRLGGGTDTFSRILDGIRSSQDAIYLMIERNDKQDNGKEHPFVLGNIRVIWQKPASMTNEGSKDRKVVFTKLNVFTSASTIAEDELNQLPSRVIDVGPAGSEDNPRLVQTASESQGHWVALSHCWGDKDKHPLRTTRQTLADHSKGIPMSSLPKTFQDAVIATRALGVRFLWIDSICIVQDDEVDWLKESEMMGTIYEHAIVTLAASAAKDSTHGLFVERPYAKIKFPSIEVPFRVQTADTNDFDTLGTFSIGLDWRQEPFMTHMDPMLTPLAQRGWCTQELILSRRIVHFLEEGMVWVCKGRSEDETGQMIIGRGLSEGDWATEWGRIIFEHSGRLFTYEKDRLVSLQGLAREVSKASNNSSSLETYYFGTFLVDIPEYILWASYRHGEKSKSCPSWSWASAGGAVWLRFRDFDYGRPDDSFGNDCKVLGVDRTSGLLSIEAKRVNIGNLISSVMERNSVNDLIGEKATRAYRQPLIQGFSIGLKDEEPYGWIEFDDDRDALSEQEDVFFLLLAQADYWTKPFPQHWGLLLVKDQVLENTFNRVGMGSAWNLSFMRDFEREVTAII
ncbi:HET-domain-containing protein [Microthyrium microscopicum]|uniref:HET-domain-containing protein n=1 Tax=Microthyrium microscopicum TaxID=703497 RepID=A0A6A6U6T3_9PEZI|nr:HET-domain-containing protein [Microthyrium microscopicum]